MASEILCPKKKFPLTVCRLLGRVFEVAEALRVAFRSVDATLRSQDLGLDISGSAERIWTIAQIWGGWRKGWGGTEVKGAWESRSNDL